MGLGCLKAVGVEVPAACFSRVGGWALCFSSAACPEKQNLSGNSSPSVQAVSLLWCSVAEDLAVERGGDGHFGVGTQSGSVQAVGKSFGLSDASEKASAAEFAAYPLLSSATAKSR